VTAPEAVSSTSPRPLRRTVFTQGWRDVTFLHWAVDPALVAPLLPDGARPDEFDGATYVGLIPFRMRRIGLFGAPGLPYLGSFAETNVRLYSVDEQGRRGVVFRSLEADRLLPVLAARWVARLPYLWSRMRVERDGDRLTYRAHRRWPGPRGAGGAVTVRVGDPLAEPGPLALFLTGHCTPRSCCASPTTWSPWPGCPRSAALRTACSSPRASTSGSARGCGDRRGKILLDARHPAHPTA
jgi:uncharacterized protein YqjF (DUF2071 family)